MHNFEVEGSKKKSRKTWKEVVDMLDLELKLGDVMDHSRWRANIKEYWCNSY